MRNLLRQEFRTTPQTYISLSQRHNLGVAEFSTGISHIILVVVHRCIDRGPPVVAVAVTLEAFNEARDHGA